MHRCRERALATAGADITLVVPSEWPDAGAETHLSPEGFRIVELPARRVGDVNRHTYLDDGAVRRLIDELRPDVLDIQEEPFSLAARQWLESLPRNVPSRCTPRRISTSASRLRSPATSVPPTERVAAFYPCSRQAASVLRGKGFAGVAEVLPLGYDDALFTPGRQSVDRAEIVLMLVGRLIPEKGADDAVRILARVHAVRPARLVVSGRGPEEALIGHWRCRSALRISSTSGAGRRVRIWPRPIGRRMSYSCRVAQPPLQSSLAALSLRHRRAAQSWRVTLAAPSPKLPATPLWSSCR